MNNRAYETTITPYYKVFLIVKTKRGVYYAKGKISGFGENGAFPGEGSGQDGRGENSNEGY
ncbi:MAG: hypothetical protein Kow0090_03360 [Myxococcota bacterium]